MADLLIWANKIATAARAAVAKGITGDQHKRSNTAKEGLRLARRFRDHQDMILRFATDLAVGFTSNQALFTDGPWLPTAIRPG